MKTNVLVVNQFMEPVGGACILPIDTSEPLNRGFEKESSDLYAKVKFGELVKSRGFLLYIAEKGQTLKTCIRIGNEPCSKDIGYEKTLEKRSLVMIPPGLWHMWSK